MSHYLFGTPEQVAAAITEHSRGAPAETVWLWGSVAGMPQDMVARHVEIICTRLRPLLEPVNCAALEPVNCAAPVPATASEGR
jgi:hypothetical protein